MNLPKPDGGALPDIQIVATPADPPPLVERAQWVYDLRYDKGDVYLLAIRPINLAAAQATPRSMGRFALELFEGPALIERARFDFPLLGAPETPDAGRNTPPSFERHLVTRIGVMMPATSRGTKLELVDRATGLRWALPWPPADAAAKRGELSDAGGAPDASVGARGAVSDAGVQTR